MTHLPQDRVCRHSGRFPPAPAAGVDAPAHPRTFVCSDSGIPTYHLEVSTELALFGPGRQRPPGGVRRRRGGGGPAAAAARHGPADRGAQPHGQGRPDPVRRARGRQRRPRDDLLAHGARSGAVGLPRDPDLPDDRRDRRSRREVRARLPARSPARRSVSGSGSGSTSTMRPAARRRRTARPPTSRAAPSSTWAARSARPVTAGRSTTSTSPRAPGSTT